MLVIYAFGGGWGHLTRAVALARIAGCPATILTNSIYADRVRAIEPTLSIEATLPDKTLPRLEAIHPETLVVDTFPRGLGGELSSALPHLPGRKVLVQRDLNPRYVAWGALDDFVAANYDLVFIPGEHEGAFPKAVVTPPWLVRDPTQIPRTALTDILVCAGGNENELHWYGEVMQLLAACHENVRCVAPVCPPGCPAKFWLQHWPAIELIAGAKVVIGGAGYNTVYECQACGIPLIAKPWPRKYDRQHRRALLSAFRCVSTAAEAVDVALQTLQDDPPREPGPGGPPWQAANLLR